MLVACGAAELLGTGLKFCSFNLKQPKVLVLLQKGYKFDDAAIFNLALIQGLQQEGKAIVLAGIVDFTDGTPDNDRITRASTGKMRTSLKHPYMWTFTFDNGIYFYKALVALESNERYDIIVFDVEGNALLSLNKQGKAGGLDLGMLDAGKYVIGNENSQSITVQVDRTNFDTTVAWIEGKAMDFIANDDLDGYNDVEIELTAPSAGTSITLDIYAKAANKKVALDGLTHTDLQFLKNGVASTPTVLTPSSTVPGRYTATVASFVADDVLGLQTWDSTKASSIINLDGPLYKSNLAETIAV